MSKSWFDGEPTASRPGLALDESNPLLSKSKPANASASLTYYDCPSPGSNSVPDWFQRQLRQGYYSAVTHTDRLFGKARF